MKVLEEDMEVTAETVANLLQCLPRGFRFHPTLEEAINHYLKPKLRGFSDGMCIIPEVDILKFEPQELPALIRGKKKKHMLIFPFLPGVRFHLMFVVRVLIIKKGGLSELLIY